MLWARNRAAGTDFAARSAAATGKEVGAGRFSRLPRKPGPAGRTRSNMAGRSIVACDQTVASTSRQPILRLDQVTVDRIAGELIAALKLAPNSPW